MMTLRCDDQCFHYRSDYADGVVVLCLTNSGFQRLIAFAYLDHIHRLFVDTVGEQRIEKANLWGKSFALSSSVSLILFNM